MTARDGVITSASELTDEQTRELAARWRRRRLRVTLELWNCWRTPRLERYADGSSSLFFGIGRLTWRR